MENLQTTILEATADQTLALCLHLNNCTLDELKSKADDELQELIDEAQEKIDDDDYLVLTDEEADDKREEELDNYLEDCIYPELQENLKQYFDDESRKSDARYDWRGHSIASYDGNENEETVNGTTYYIYRMN